MTIPSFKWSTTAHARQRTLLGKSISGDRRSHAYLLHGPSHIGKRRIAHDLATFLLCENIDAKPCGMCPNCRTGHINPDVSVLRATGSDIGIDATRSFLQSMRTTPVSHIKIGLIEDGSRMTIVAANALLKLLEEPPTSSILIIIADTLQSVPATILSRCQLVKFNRMSKYEMESIISSGKSNNGFSDAFRIAQGRISKADEYLNDDFTSYRSNMRQALSFLKESSIQRLLEVSDLEKNTPETHTESSYIEKARPVLLVLDHLEMIIRDVLLTHSAPKLRVHDAFSKEVDVLAKRYPIEVLPRILHYIGELRYTIGRNANIKIALEYLSIAQL